MNKKNYDKQFKAKVTLEALKEDVTIQELANKYEVHHTLIRRWKKQMVEGLPDIFERPNKKSAEERIHEGEKENLLKAIGEMKIENDFLKKKYRQLYGKEPF